MAEIASEAQLEIPQSSSTVSVSIIDTVPVLTGIPSAVFFGPTLPGFESFKVAAYSFLITHTDHATSKTRKVLFDLGPPSGWKDNLAPPMAAGVQSWVDGGAVIDVPQDVAEKLAEGGTDLTSIEALIWSHPHWDHIGRPSTFPSSVSLLYGPGVKETHGNGYPEKEGAPFKTSEIEGRKIEEVSFGANLQIGGFDALDYFGDGSFYLLNVPGHCVGHVNGLARVGSNPDSFILLGADSFHFPGQFRPSMQVPLPSEVRIDDKSISTSKFGRIHPSQRYHKTSAGAAYDKFTADSNLITSPFFTISVHEDGSSLAHRVDDAREAIQKLQAFDADDRVFVVTAHDESLHEILEYYPNSSANGWREKGWKERGRWAFLKTLEPILAESDA